MVAVATDAELDCRAAALAARRAGGIVADFILDT
jgi:hypothetical protein